MAKTHAERQRDYRSRQARRVAGLEHANADLSGRLATAQADLSAALAELERFTAAQCKHPAEAVDGGRCNQCGQDLW
jgi:hypothetical protein